MIRLARGSGGRKPAAVISPGAVIASVLPVYLLIVAGAALRKAGIIRQQDDAGVMRVIFLVMAPCFILDKILGSGVLRSGPVVLWSVGLGYAMIVAGIGIGIVVARALGMERGTGMRTFALSAGCQNFGFTAVPVVETLWGTGALALLFVHNIGTETAVWTIGVAMLGGEGGFSWKRLINGPVVAVAIGLTLVALRLDDKITGPGREAMSMVGAGAFPLAILITGCSMMDLVGQERPSLRVIGGAALVRLVATPVAILAAAKYFPVSRELREVMIVQAAMPAGMTPILLARMYGGRPAVAVQVVLATTVLSLLTLPWIITWGSAWMDLKPALP